MVSKKTKVIIAVLTTAGILSWAGWQLFKPKPNDNFSQKEISIKQADIPKVETVIYRDWAGFEFEYPNILTIKEVELDNPYVYSSLELESTDGKKMNIRISDTQVADLIGWQKIFNQENSVRKIDQTTLGNFPAAKLQYGAPEMITVVAINDKILYQLETQADAGFWNRTIDDVVTSFRLTNNAAASPAAASTGAATANESITLIEETIE